MAKGKNVLTTGDVAKICNVAPRTVSKWFDSGQLRGYRIPGSKDRRIPLSELMRFMKAHNIPGGALPVGQIRVLIVDSDPDTAASTAQALTDGGDYDVTVASSNFEAGLAAQRTVPHVMLVNLLAEKIDAWDLCKSIRQNEDLDTTKLIALTNGLSEPETAALLQKGFDDWAPAHPQAPELLKRIEEAMAIVY